MLVNNLWQRNKLWWHRQNCVSAPNVTKLNHFTPLPPPITSLHHFWILWWEVHVFSQLFVSCILNIYIYPSDCNNGIIDTQKCWFWLTCDKKASNPDIDRHNFCTYSAYFNIVHPRKGLSLILRDTELLSEVGTHDYCSLAVGLM